MRNLFRAGIVLALTASLAACNVNSASQEAIKQILANPAALTPAQLTNAIEKVDPALATKIETVGNQAVAIVTASCGLVPFASSLAAIAAAAYGAQGVVLPATQIAEAFSTPFLTPSKTPKVTRFSAPKVGSDLTRTVRVEGIDIPVTGTVVAPALIR